MVEAKGFENDTKELPFYEEIVRSIEEYAGKLEDKFKDEPSKIKYSIRESVVDTHLISKGFHIKRLKFANMIASRDLVPGRNLD